MFCDKNSHKTHRSGSHIAGYSNECGCCAADCEDGSPSGGYFQTLSVELLYDNLILAAASEQGCRVVLSEDLQSGFKL